MTSITVTVVDRNGQQRSVSVTEILFRSIRSVSCVSSVSSISSVGSIGGGSSCVYSEYDNV